MTTSFASGECIGQVQSPIARDECAEDSLKIVSLLPLENDDSVAVMIIPTKQVKSSSFTSVSEKDNETVHSDSIKVSIPDTSSLLSKETEAINVENRETGSEFPEENKVGDELRKTKEISEISTEGDQFGDDLLKKEEEVVETNGCVVSISESQDLVTKKEGLTSEKKRKDSIVQRLLEAEKRRSLTGIEVGPVWKKKDDVNKLARDFHKIKKIGNGSKENPEKMERVRVKDNAFVGRSVQIELVDDTALLDVVRFCQKGKDHPKRSGTVHNDKDASRNHKKPFDEKENAPKVVERNESTKVSEFRNGGETNGKQLRIMYSRDQMESMRYNYIANQKKLWSDMYANLLPDVVTEYEGLVGVKYQKTSKSYPSESDISILGPVSIVPRRTRVNIFVH